MTENADIRTVTVKIEGRVQGVFFRAWTEPDRLDWYYNPAQPIPEEPIELDLRVGGVWRQRMIVDEDTAYDTGGIYREIVPGEKLVFTWGATDGWPRLDSDDLDASPLVTVMLSETEGGTELMLHVEVPESLVEQQTVHRLEEIARQMMNRGIDPRTAQLDWEGAREELKVQAAEDVRATMLMEKIADLVNDKVITTSGIHGQITRLNDQVVQLQIADKVRIDVSRAAIGGYQGQPPVVESQNP